MGITLAHLKEAVDRLLDRIALVAQTASKSIEEMEKTKADKVNIMSLTIPASGWSSDSTAGCPYYLDIPVSGLTANDCVAVVVAPTKSVGRYWYSCDVAIEGCDSSYVPMGTLTLDTAGEVEKANLATVLQTVEGGVRFYAAIPPKVNIRAFVTLFAKGTASMQQASAEEVQRMLDEIFNG